MLTNSKDLPRDAFVSSSAYIPRSWWTRTELLVKAFVSMCLLHQNSRKCNTINTGIHKKINLQSRLLFWSYFTDLTEFIVESRIFPMQLAFTVQLSTASVQLSMLHIIQLHYITLHYIQKHQRWVCLHDRSHFYNRCCFPVSKCNIVIFFTIYNKLEIQPNLTANFSIWHDILSKLFSCLSTTILEDIL